MATKSRSRRAEAARRMAQERRIKLESELGVSLSPAQLRGRPRKGELSISVRRIANNGSPEDKLDYVAREVYRGKSASQARKEVRFSEARFKEAIKGDKTFVKAKGRYQVAVQERFRFIDRDGQSRENVPLVVTDVYARRCAVTRERTLPALEAAHIRPYADGGSHDPQNG